MCISVQRLMSGSGDNLLNVTFWQITLVCAPQYNTLFWKQCMHVGGSRQCKSTQWFVCDQHNGPNCSVIFVFVECKCVWINDFSVVIVCHMPASSTFFIYPFPFCSLQLFSIPRVNGREGKEQCLGAAAPQHSQWTNVPFEPRWGDNNWPWHSLWHILWFEYGQP